MKYYLKFEDGCYDQILTFDELYKQHEIIIDLIKHHLFGSEFSKHAILSYDYQYTNFYELETKLEIEQVKKVIEQEFYIDVYKICECLGKITKIK